MKKVWFDITNTPQVHFLVAIYKALKDQGGFDYVFSARDFSETITLLKRKIDIPFQVIGRHSGKSKARKAAGLLYRFKEIAVAAPNYNISISCGSEAAVWLSFLRRRVSIAFGDNDQARQWTYAHFVDFAFFPDAIPAQILNRQGLNESRLYRYAGYKEDIYLADYQPDESFLGSLPFDHYVLVRPENIMANYIGNNSVQTITPELLKALNAKGLNVLYLPRYEFDKAYANGLTNIHVPDSPVNGLDACFFADAVLTGAGTLAREAACLGVPSFSFYAGRSLLAVDRKMIADRWMRFSRDPLELVQEVMRATKKETDLARSKAVKEDVMAKLKEVILNRFQDHQQFQYRAAVPK
jgi:uncharacterized protein